MRLGPLLVSLGYVSTRREAAQWARSGRVAVVGATADADARVVPADVTVDGEPLDHPDGLLLVMHKPLGRVCTRAADEGPTVYELLPPRWLRRDPALVTVGRLDKDTDGVLLITDRHPLVHQLTSPRRHVEKVYEATLDDDVSDAAIAMFGAGVQLRGEDAPCRPAALEPLGPRRARVTLSEGRYHQVRRMFAAVGRRVVTLTRTRFGPITLDDLAPGAWRHLDPHHLGTP